MFKLILTLLIPLSLIGCSDITSNYHGKGTMKKWMQEKTQSAGLDLRWNMNGDYDIEELHKQELKDIPLGQTVKLLERNMILNNLTKYLEWPTSHAGQQYPYPIMVVTAVCKNTLVFAEVIDFENYTKNLMEGKYEGCIPVDSNLGFKPTPLSNTPVTPTSNLPAASRPNLLPPLTVTPSMPNAFGQEPTLVPPLGDSEKDIPPIEQPKK